MDSTSEDKIRLIEKLISENVSYGQLSGAVFNSTKMALKESPICLMGTNPGGDPIKLKNQTISKIFQDETTLFDELSSWDRGSVYLDKIRFISEFFEINDIEKIPFTNLIFERSISIEKYEESKKGSVSYYVDVTEFYIKIHKLILDIINPTYLIVFGNAEDGTNPFNYFERFKIDNIDYFQLSSKTYIKCFVADIENRKQNIIAIPHLSRFNIQNREVWKEALKVFG